MEYAADINHVRQWAAFTKSLGVEATPSLGVVIDKISEFVLPPAIAAATVQPFNLQWKPQNRGMKRKFRSHIWHVSVKDM